MHYCLFAGPFIKKLNYASLVQFCSVTSPCTRLKSPSCSACRCHGLISAPNSDSDVIYITGAVRDPRIRALDYCDSYTDDHIASVCLVPQPGTRYTDSHLSKTDVYLLVSVVVLVCAQLHVFSSLGLYTNTYIRQKRLTETGRPL